MSGIEKLSPSEVEAALAELPGWAVVNGKLQRVFKFKDFSAAFGFMARAALEVHRADHHPEWSNVYSKVTIDLVTHSAGGITRKDIDLAARFNEYSNAEIG